MNELQELRAATRFVPKWYSVAEVADELGYGLSKTKLLVATGQIRSLNDGGHRASFPHGWTGTSPEWVAE